MKRGRKTTPSAIAIYNGNPSQKSATELTDAIQPVAIASIEAPEHLDEVATTEWNRLAPILSGYNILSELDKHTLAMYCNSWSTYMDCTYVLRTEGRTYANAKGLLQARPEVAMQRNAFKEIIRIATEFGMTPSSRAGIQISFNEAKKSTSELLDELDNQDDWNDE